MEMELEFLEEDGDVYVTCIDCFGPLDGPIWDIGLAWAKLQDGNELFVEFQKCLKNNRKDILMSHVKCFFTRHADIIRPYPELHLGPGQ